MKKYEFSYAENVGYYFKLCAISVKMPNNKLRIVGSVWGYICTILAKIALCGPLCPNKLAVLLTNVFLVYWNPLPLLAGCHLEMIPKKTAVENQCMKIYTKNKSLSMTDCSDSRAGDCGSKGSRFKFIENCK